MADDTCKGCEGTGYIWTGTPGEQIPCDCDTPCPCGKGEIVYLDDGTRCCTCTLAKFELKHGHPYAGVAQSTSFPVTEPKRG